MNKDRTQLLIMFAQQLIGYTLAQAGYSLSDLVDATSITMSDYGTSITKQELEQVIASGAVHFPPLILREINELLIEMQEKI